MAKRRHIRQAVPITVKFPTYHRYVFFDSLLHSSDTSQTYLGYQYQATINQWLSPILKTKPEDPEALEYIDAFLLELEAWAARERAQEQRFLQLAETQKALTPGTLTNYYDDNGEFSYIKFIKDINLAKESIKQFQRDVNIHYDNLSMLKNAIGDEKSKEIVLTNNRFNRPEEIQSVVYELLSKEEKNALKDSTINQQLNQLDSIIVTVLTQDSVVNAVQNQILNGVSLENIKQELFNSLLEGVVKEYDPLTDITKLVTQRIQNIGNNVIDQTLHTVVQEIEKTADEMINTFVDKGFKSGEGLFDEIKKINEIWNYFFSGSSDTNPLLQAFNKYKEAEKKFKNNGEINAASLAGYKGRISFLLKREIQKQIEDFTKIAPNGKQQLKDTLIAYANNHSQMNAKNFISSCIRRFKITGPDLQEVRAAVQSEFEGVDLKSYVPGKTIKLKNDVTISYSLDLEAFKNLKSQLTSQQLDDVKRIVGEFGKNFLINYNTLAGGSTNVGKAYEAYNEQLKNLYDHYSALLKNAKTDLEKNNIQKAFEFLSSGISVKKYEDVTYLNQGFHAGSLGGSGKVVDAIPNITKMLELGGISLVDSEAIISALINNFSDSVIGKTYEEPLKNYLIAGAAMMLFDDGFANGKKFLNNMNQELKQIAPGSFHLLYVNDVYIPQSYLLQNICENLRKLQTDIHDEFVRMTSGEVSSRLLINNPITYNNLRQVQNKQTQEERFEAMKQFAEKEVKISFLFLAGMLDILESLRTEFDQVDKVK